MPSSCSDGERIVQQRMFGHSLYLFSEQCKGFPLMVERSWGRDPRYHAHRGFPWLQDNASPAQIHRFSQRIDSSGTRVPLPKPVHGPPSASRSPSSPQSLQLRLGPARVPAAVGRRILRITVPRNEINHSPTPGRLTPESFPARWWCQLER